MLKAAQRRYVGLMSAQPIHSPKVMSVPAATPAEIRAVLVNAEEPELLKRFECALESAYIEGRDAGSIEPLNAMLKRWRLEAAQWCDPVKQKAFVARMDDWAKNGVPPEHRADPDEVLAILKAKGASAEGLEKLRPLAARR